jgi:acyl-CoA dehydrogenase
MVDFRLSQNDREILEQIRQEGLVTRKYARHYDDHEDELSPAKLPEADAFPLLLGRISSRPADDTPAATFQMLMSIARSWGDSVVLRQVSRGLGNAALLAAGTPEQKQRWGGTVLAMAITEPGCGSDTKAITTTARREVDSWVISGEKIFVTTGIRAQGVVVWATVDAKSGRAGIKSFVVMKGTPGFEITRKEKKLGIRSSDTAALTFTECRVPLDHLLGGDESVPQQGSGGFRGVMKTFNMTRPGVAAGGIGKARASLDFAHEALAAEGVRVDWDHGRSSRGAAAARLVQMEADTEAATLAVLRAAWLADVGEENNLEASVAKSKGGEVSRTVPQGCIEVLGAMGASKDYLVEKWLRDGRITDIYEGTGQIQRLIIARAIFGYTSDELS